MYLDLARLERADGLKLVFGGAAGIARTTLCAVNCSCQRGSNIHSTKGPSQCPQIHHKNRPDHRTKEIPSMSRPDRWASLPPRGGEVPAALTDPPSQRFNRPVTLKQPDCSEHSADRQTVASTSYKYIPLRCPNLPRTVSTFVGVR